MINSIKSVKEKFNIYAIDINSKFEIKYGFKDIEKIKKFIALL
jgi:phosphoribosylanthranilate isomerase